MLDFYFVLYRSVSSKGGISSSSSSHRQSALPTVSSTRSGWEFGGIFSYVALIVAKGASANSDRESLVACDRLGWISFALGTF